MRVRDGELEGEVDGGTFALNPHGTSEQMSQEAKQLDGSRGGG